MKKYLIILFALLGFGVFMTKNTYAVEDYSVTVSDANVFVLCAPTSWNLDVPACGSYSYINFSDNSLTGSSVYLGSSSSVNFGEIRFSSIENGSLNLTLTDNDYLRFAFGNYSSGSIKFTLSDHLPGSSCPEPPAPEPCEDPEENSQFIKVVIDAFWKYHQVFAGCVAALIAIFVVYRLIKGAFR